MTWQVRVYPLLVDRSDSSLLELGTLLAVKVRAAESQAGEGLGAEGAPEQVYAVSFCKIFLQQIKFAHRNIGLYILLPFMMRPSPVPSRMACIFSGGMFASFGTSTFVLPRPATCITWKSLEDNDNSIYQLSGHIVPKVDLVSNLLFSSGWFKD